MHGFMNEEALRRTIETGGALLQPFAKAVWHKGAPAVWCKTLLKCELTTTRIAFGCAYASAAMAQLPCRVQVVFLPLFADRRPAGRAGHIDFRETKSL